MQDKLKVIIYASHLNKIGGIETFVHNFCKRLRDSYDLQLHYDVCDPILLSRIKQHVNCIRLTTQKVNCDRLILATAWGRSPEGYISAHVQIQMVHADYVAYIEGWKFTYRKQPSTTHHVAVSKHVAKQFEIATKFKIDKVIYNLL